MVDVPSLQHSKPVDIKIKTTYSPPPELVLEEHKLNAT